MKFKKYILFGLVILIVNCMPGSQREACRYNAEPKKTSCEFSQLLVLISTSRTASVSGELLTANALLECQKYYEEIEKCKKEENNYIPSIYG